jgi:hypothetical protein
MDGFPSLTFIYRVFVLNGFELTPSITWTAMSSLMLVTISRLHWRKLLTLVRLSCKMRCDLTITNPKFNIDWLLEDLHQRR